MKKLLLISATLCTLPFASAQAQSAFDKMMKAGFQANGQAGLDRINQDATQKFCSDAKNLTDEKSGARRAEIEKINMATIKQPSDGKYIGDWKSGERIAQSGRGATWTDKAGTPVGGGCYNCHQINKAEISHGNIGPSLWNYGKMRGYSKEVVEYTCCLLYTSDAADEC
jgi:sulfur-oxidizing protein SoxX